MESGSICRGRQFLGWCSPLFAFASDSKPCRIGISVGDDDGQCCRMSVDRAAVRLYGACRLDPELRLFLTVGFCGGFTTFSTFIHENYILLGGGHFLLFALYSILSFALGLLAVYLGISIVKAFA